MRKLFLSVGRWFVWAVQYQQKYHGNRVRITNALLRVPEENVIYMAIRSSEVFKEL